MDNKKLPLCTVCGDGLGEYHMLYDGVCATCLKENHDLLVERVKKLEVNQRPKYSRRCGYCGWEQILVSGEWKCGSCSKQRKIDDLSKKFALEIADMRMRLAVDSRKRIDELKKARDKLLALLLEIEYAGRFSGYPHNKACPKCWVPINADHKPDCVLDNALNGSE